MGEEGGEKGGGGRGDTEVEETEAGDTEAGGLPGGAERVGWRAARGAREGKGGAGRMA